MDDEELFLERNLFPWIDDPVYDEGGVHDDWDYSEEADEYFCEACDCGLTAEEADGESCPECGHPFTGSIE